MESERIEIGLDREALLDRGRRDHVLEARSRRVGGAGPYQSELMRVGTLDSISSPSDDEDHVGQRSSSRSMGSTTHARWHRKRAGHKTTNLDH